MIPSFDVVPEIVLPADDDCGYPSRDEISEEGFGFFRGTWFIGRVPISEARAVVKFETELVAALDVLSVDRGQFEVLARGVEGYDADAAPPIPPMGSKLEPLMRGFDDDSPLGGLEIGVAGLTYALSAVGFLTAASCRSHEGEGSWGDCPVVLFGAHKWRAVVLAELAARHGCGIGQDREMLTVYAPSILNLMTLAEAVLSESKRFRHKPAGVSRSALGDKPVRQQGELGL